jgi:hypothetical protein
MDDRADIKHDLNNPIDLGQAYDTVFDCGTIEHVANIGEVLQTYHKATKAGGSIVITSVTDGFQTHGFYQLNPLLFFKIFSRVNGYECECFSYRVGPFAKLRKEKWLDEQRMTFQIPRVIVVRASKISHIEKLTWPIQDVFLVPHIPCKHWKLKMVKQFITSFFQGLR